jgi:hypothetical protein
MKTLSRILSLVISLQLAVGCSGSQISLLGSGGSGFGSAFLSGSIASLEAISDAIMPSAMAAGTLTVYTLDPISLERDQEIYQEDVLGASVGHTYKIEIPKKHEGKLMEVVFTDSDASIITKSEIEYIPAVESKENQEVKADLSQAGTVASIVTKALLNQEIVSGIKEAEIPVKLKELKIEDKKPIFQMLGADNEAILTQMILNKTTVDQTLKYIVEYSALVAKEGVLSAGKVATQILELGVKSSFIEKSQLMFCTRTDVQFFNLQEKSNYYISFDTTDADILKLSKDVYSSVDAKSVADNFIGKVREMAISKKLESIPNLVLSLKQPLMKDGSQVITKISACPISSSGIAPLDESEKVEIVAEEAVKLDMNIVRNADASSVTTKENAYKFYYNAIEAARVEMRQRLSLSSISPDRWDALIEAAALDAQNSLPTIVEEWTRNRIRYNIKHFDAVALSLDMELQKASDLLKAAGDNALKEVDERLLALHIPIEESDICYIHQKQLVEAEFNARYNKWKIAYIAATGK